MIQLNHTVKGLKPYQVKNDILMPVFRSVKYRGCEFVDSLSRRYVIEIHNKISDGTTLGPFWVNYCNALDATIRKIYYNWGQNKK